MQQGDLARAIGRASFDEAGWPAVVAGLAQHLGAAGAYFFSPCESTGVRSFGETVDLPPEMNRHYHDYYHQHDVVLAAAREQDLLHAGTVLRTRNLVPDAVLKHTSFYNEFLQPYGMHDCLVSILTDEDDSALGPRTHMAFCRPETAHEFTDEDERRLAVLVPQLRLALLSHWKLRSEGLLGEWNELLLAQIEQPFFLLSRGGRMLFGNQAALNLVRDSRALSLVDGVLCRGGHVPLVAQFDPLSSLPVEMPALPPDGPAMRVIPLQASRNTQSMFHWFPRAAYVVLPQAAAAAARRGQHVDHEFARRHGLTRAEETVLARVVQGLSPRDVAASQQLSVHTVRAHLAHIFAKTGMRNQRELLAAVLRARMT